jgi:isopentenyl phosphate kinase
MENLIIIKLGGSVITDKSKPFCAKEKVIQRLANEILTAQKKFKGNLLITHGSGSFGHTVASKYKTHKGLINKKSLEGAVLTSEAAIEINRIVMGNLVKSGLKVKTFAPASFIFAENNNPSKTFSEPIVQALLTGLNPVIYGDVVTDKKMGFCIFSAEKVIGTLIKGLNKYFGIEKIIFCTDTDGVYDSRGITIPRITQKNITKYEKEIGGSKSADITGGMLHKVKQSLELGSKYGVETLIINGKRKGYLTDAIVGGKVQGTTILG